MALNIHSLSSNTPREANKQQSSLDAVAAFLSKDISFSKPRMSDKRKEFFYSELLILLTSGVDIKTAIEIIEEQSSNKIDRDLYAGILAQIIAGASLSQALHSTGLFSNYEYFSIQIGEESGKITHVLAALHDFYSNKIKQTRKLVNSLSYPVLVLGMAIAAVAFMLYFMVPMFVDIFARFDAEMPALTQYIVNISNFFSHNIAYILLGGLVLAGAYLYVRTMPGFRRWASFAVLKIPLVGELIRMIYIQRFFQAMSLLVAARTPMLRAIQLVRNMVNFYTLEQSLDAIEQSILQGDLLYASMKKTGFFDSRVTALIKVAEEVNQLDTIFASLSERYTQELEHRVGIMTSMLEPLLIIFVGILVAIILISMYLPMFKLSTAMY